MIQGLTKLAIGDVTFETLALNAGTFQPAGTIIYRVLWVAAGGQADQSIILKDTDDAGISVPLNNKDSGQKNFNGFAEGTIQGSFTHQGGMNGAYINNQIYLSLDGASSSGNEVIFALMQVTD